MTQRGRKGRKGNKNPGISFRGGVGIFRGLEVISICSFETILLYYNSLRDSLADLGFSLPSIVNRTSFNPASIPARISSLLIVSSEDDLLLKVLSLCLSLLIQIFRCKTYFVTPVDGKGIEPERLEIV